MERVSDLMTRDVINTIQPNTSVAEAARRMKDVHRGCLVVVDDGRRVGIITQRDLVEKVIAKNISANDVRVFAIMSTGVISVGPEALISDAARIMAENKIRRLIVTEGPHVIGVLTTTDFARSLYEKSQADPMLRAMARAAFL